MSILLLQRPSDSPYVETIMHGHTLSAESVVRPAECCWYMVFVKSEGHARMALVGPWTPSGIASWGAGGEGLWIKFKLGTFMPHLPVRAFRDSEIILPDASSKSFWLKGSAWQFPDYDNVETFVNRLMHDEILVHDSLVPASLQDQQPNVSPRTVRHRFLQATGLTQSHIRQFVRAQQAAALLQQGVPILDTVYEAGFFDQSHLTRALKRFIGTTPAQRVAQA